MWISVKVNELVRPSPPKITILNWILVPEGLAERVAFKGVKAPITGLNTGAAGQPKGTSPAVTVLETDSHVLMEMSNH